MAVLNSAGVYVFEKDLSQVIVAQSTAIAAFVFASSKGPTYERKYITSGKKFKEVYGKQNAKVSFAHYCALAYFESSNQAWCVRVTGANASYGGVLLTNDTGSTKANPLALSKPLEGVYEGFDNPLLNLSYIYAQGPGSYADNIAIEVRSDNVKPITTGHTATVSTTDGTLTGTAPTYKVTVTNVSGEFEYISSFPPVTLTGSTNSISLTWPAVRSASAYNVYKNGVFIESVTANGYTDVGMPALGKAYPTEFTTVSTFDLLVYDLELSKGVAQEAHTVSFKRGVDGFGRQTELQEVITANSSILRCVNHANDLSNVPVVYDIPQTKLTGGSSGELPTNANYIKGWELFRSTDDVSVTLLVNAGYSNPAIQLKMDAIASARQDAVAILDVPSNLQESSKAVDYRRNALNMNSNRSALYTPDVYIYDDENDLSLYIPPSGHIAGRYAYNDYVAEAWFAPAGLNRGLLAIQGVRHIYEQGDRDLLAPNQVNYIRKFPGQGYAVWEQLTLQAKTSALSYVNVRRLLDVIEVATAKALLYSVHEPNDDILRTSIVNMIGMFLDNVRKRRGIKKFLVVCNDDNNSPQSVSEGILNIDVYIEPTLPATKLKLNMVIMKQGMSFTEAIQAGGSN